MNPFKIFQRKPVREATIAPDLDRLIKITMAVAQVAEQKLARQQTICQQ